MLDSGGVITCEPFVNKRSKNKRYCSTRQAQLRALHLCVWCKEPAPEASLCPGCRAVNQQRQLARYHRLNPTAKFHPKKGRKAGRNE